MILFYFKPRMTLIAFCALTWLAVEALCRARGIEVDYVSFLPTLKFALGFWLAAVGLLVLRQPYIAMLAESTALVALLVTPIFVSTFLAISTRMPLADDWLMAADRMMGFDWVAYIYAIDRYPLLIRLYSFVYDAFYLLILAVPLLLVAQRDIARAYGFVFGFGFLCLVSSAISIWFPSMGAFYSHGVLPEDLQHMVPVVGYGFLEQFLIACNGDFTKISMENMSGILSFPSVHAGVAFWVMWSAKRLPVIGWPICLTSLAMAVSAISHGSHYFVDIIAGLGVAVLTAAVVRLCFSGELRVTEFAGPVIEGEMSEEVRSKVPQSVTL